MIFLDSLIDFVVLHVLQYQQIPSLISHRFLSVIVTAHLYTSNVVSTNNLDVKICASCLEQIFV